MDEAARALAGTPADRQAKCLRTRIGGQGGAVGVHRSATGGVWVSGVVRCGHWTCPACGVARARESAERLTECFSAHLAGLGHDVWLLTLTLPHYEGEQTKYVAALYAAWRTFTAGRVWKNWKRRWGVVAAVRALDVTFRDGGTRWHPHFHVAVFARAAWLGLTPLRGMTPDERAEVLRTVGEELKEAWAQAVLATGLEVKSRAALVETGAHLGGGEFAACYLGKWGLDDEIGGAAFKDASHLSLLDAGTEQARASYLAWRLAVDGRHWLSGLADACRVLGVVEVEDKPEDLPLSQGEVAEVEPINVWIEAWEWPAVLRRGVGAVVAVVASATTQTEAEERVRVLLYGEGRWPPSFTVPGTA